MDFAYGWFLKFFWVGSRFDTSHPEGDVAKNALQFDFPATKMNHRTKHDC